MSRKWLERSVFFTDSFGDSSPRCSGDRDSFFQTSDFILERFVDLPWPVIQRVLADLPKKYIYYVFLDVPSLRDLVIDEYYKEIKFAFAEDGLSEEEVQKELNEDFKDYYVDLNYHWGLGRCSLFLKDHAGVVPRKAQIDITSNLLKTVLEKHAGYFQQIAELCIAVYGQCDEKHLLINTLRSFSNLKSLDLHPVETGATANELDISDMHTLERVAIHNTDSASLISICLPNSLNELAIRKCSNDTMGRRRGSQPNKHNQTPLGGLKLPLLLKSLIITECEVSILFLSQLPASLEAFTLTKSRLGEIRHERGARWPSGLESLDLSDNSLNSTLIRQLSSSRLPSGLRVLKLSNNRFDLYHLRALPKGLKVLDLSNNRRMSLEIPAVEGSYSFYQFPEGLEVLDISNCRLKDNSSQTERMRFPSSLMELKMDGLGESSFNDLWLPSSLRSLSLKNFGITDLTMYESSSEGIANDPSITWRALKSLQHLSLVENWLDTLEGWVPPPNLESLDLSSNMFREVSPDWPLFSQEYLERGIRSIDLHDNEIKVLNETVRHRLRFTNVNLSDNNGPCTMWYEMMAGAHS